jgi:hypothetical protein
MSIGYNTTLFGVCQIFLYNIFMELIKNQNSWTKFIKNKLKSYNLEDSKIDNNFKPQEFPCLAQSYINSDVNGLRLKFVFAYKKDCKKLLSKV